MTKAGEHGNVRGSTGHLTGNHRTVLVGDFGGTNVRLALAHRGADGAVRIDAASQYRTAQLSSPENLLERFIAPLPEAQRPALAYLGVAGPVADGRAMLTNAALTFSEVSLAAAGIGSVRLLNDFEALGYAVPCLGPQALLHCSGPADTAFSNGFAVLGAGTGFGVSCAPSAAGTVLVSEGGHIGFAPSDDVEMAILKQLQARHGRVSIERILSGPGLIALHDVMRVLHGHAAMAPITSARQIIDDAQSGAALARETVERFVQIFGAVAGDFALAFGARGGIFLAGGVTRGLAALIASPLFRERFEDKGRLRAYCEAIPVAVVTADNAAHAGLARLAFAQLDGQR